MRAFCDSSWCSTVSTFYLSAVLTGWIIRMEAVVVNQRVTNIHARLGDGSPRVRVFFKFDASLIFDVSHSF